MKNLVTHYTLIESNNRQWTWPTNDQASWSGQAAFLDLRKQIEPYLKGRSTMIQAGGNCGLVVDTFIDLFDTIYTFEPDPINFYCLTQNVDSPNVVKMQACLGEGNRPLSMQPLKAHVVDVGGFHVDETPGIIPMFTIDSLNLYSCDLIQLDIEGYEYKALTGAIKTIKKFRPVICLEMTDEYLARYNNTPRQILEVLGELEYDHVMSYGSDKIFVPKQ
jgi:FkbM family methyltransferase